MSPPLETVLMMQYKLAFPDACGIVAEGRSNLGVEGRSSDWDEILLAECTRLIENKGKTLAEDSPGNEKPQASEATMAQDTPDDSAAPSSNDTVESKCIFAATKTEPSSPTSSPQGNTRATTPPRVRPTPMHSQRSRPERTCDDDQAETKQKMNEKADTVVAEDDNHSEATAADAECNVSLSERQGEDGEEVDVDAVTKRNAAIVKQVIHHTKTQRAIKNKKIDEESTVTTVDSSLSDIPAVIYVIRDVDNLNQTKNRSLSNQRKKSKNMLVRLRKSFSKPHSKKNLQVLDEDSPEAYKNTFVSI